MQCQRCARPATHVIIRVLPMIGIPQRHTLMPAEPTIAEPFYCLKHAQEYADEHNQAPVRSPVPPPASIRRPRPREKNL